MKVGDLAHEATRFLHTWSKPTLLKIVTSPQTLSYNLPLVEKRRFIEKRIILQLYVVFGLAFLLNNSSSELHLTDCI